MGKSSWALLFNFVILFIDLQFDHKQTESAVSFHFGVAVLFTVLGVFDSMSVDNPISKYSFKRSSATVSSCFDESVLVAFLAKMFDGFFQHLLGQFPVAKVGIHRHPTKMGYFGTVVVGQPFLVDNHCSSVELNQRFEVLGILGDVFRRHQVEVVVHRLGQILPHNLPTEKTVTVKGKHRKSFFSRAHPKELAEFVKVLGKSHQIGPSGCCGLSAPKVMVLLAAFGRERKTNAFAKDVSDSNNGNQCNQNENHDDLLELSQFNERSTY